MNREPWRQGWTLAALITTGLAGPGQLPVAVLAGSVDVPAERRHIDSDDPFPSVPPSSQWLPGEQKGEVHARWLAPFVTITAERFGGQPTNRVRWFDEDGNIVQEVTGCDDRADFVSVGQTFYGVKERWKLDLPERPDWGRGGEICCTRDSRTFIHVYHPTEGQVAVDTYVRGEHVATVGPYWQSWPQVDLGRDGSLAMLTWKSEEKKARQVVAVDPRGNPTFAVDCPDGPDADGSFTLYDLKVAPGGSGVLVEVRRNTFTFIDRTGVLSARQVNWKDACVAWIPGTRKAIVSAGAGYRDDYLLIDWSSGKILWNREGLDPDTVNDSTRVGGLCATFAFPDDKTIIAAYHRLDPTAPGGSGLPVPYVAVLSVDDGRYLARLRHAGGDLVTAGGRLFLVTANAFSEITVSQVMAQATLQAAAEGDLERLTEVVESDPAVVGYTDQFGFAPLHYSSANGHKEAAELLVAKGADVGSRDGQGCTPLHYAAQKGRKDIAVALVAAGADVNAKGSHGKTPLHSAVEGGSKDLVEFLVSKGADVSAAYDSPRFSSYVRGQTALVLALQADAKDTAELLIRHGADVNVRSTYRGGDPTTPLRLAVSHGWADVVELLLERGARLNEASEDGTAILGLAVYYGSRAVVEVLLAHGADIHAMPAEGRSLLHRAGSVEIAEFLVAKGFNVNAKSDLGTTPLHAAAARGCKEVVEFLLDNGAEVDARNREGKTPLDVAGGREKTEIQRVLREHGAAQ